MWYEYLPAGPVAITVLAPSLYVNTPQQPYALAVQVRMLPYIVAEQENLHCMNWTLCACG